MEAYTKSKKIYDCIVVGAGPGGLTAALYLKRFLRDILVIADGNSRASLIPISHNFPSETAGISGPNLLRKMTRSLSHYQQHLIKDRVLKIKREKKNFILYCKNKSYLTKKIILATGVVDIEPDLPNLTFAIKKGLIRHCPICDAYEASQKKIAILGDKNKGVSEALFLRTYSDDITLFNLGDKLTSYELKKLKQANIKLVSHKISQVELKKKKIVGFYSNNQRYGFDIIYSALGAVVRSELAVALGARCSSEKYLIVDKFQQTSIAGIYAVGDVAFSLSQIVVAMGQAAIAATAIHKELS